MGLNLTFYSENYTIDLSIKKQWQFTWFNKKQFFFVDFGPFYFAFTNYKGL